MTRQFKTKDKAYFAVSEEEQMYGQEHYCPLLKNNCNPDCICFLHSRVTNSNKGTHPWKVSKNFGCTNKMFFGD